MATLTTAGKGLDVYIRENSLPDPREVKRPAGNLQGKMSHADYMQFKEAGCRFDDLFVDMLNWNFWVVEAPGECSKGRRPGRYLVKTLKRASLSELLSEYLACSGLPPYPSA